MVQQKFSYHYSFFLKHNTLHWTFPFRPLPLESWSWPYNFQPFCSLDWYKTASSFQPPHPQFCSIVAIKGREGVGDQWFYSFEAGQLFHARLSAGFAFGTEGNLSDWWLRLTAVGSLGSLSFMSHTSHTAFHNNSLRLIGFHHCYFPDSRFQRTQSHCCTLEFR